MKILILASNPRKDLHLDREIRDLRAVIESSRQQQAFQVEDALAVRVGDLQDLLFRHRPHIVHFCGLFTLWMQNGLWLKKQILAAND